MVARTKQLILVMFGLLAVLLQQGCGVFSDKTSDLDQFLDGEDKNKQQQEQVAALEAAQPVEYRCASEFDPRYYYKKRLLVLGFANRAPRSTVDLPYLSIEYAQALQLRIDRERLLPIDASNQVPPESVVRASTEQFGRAMNEKARENRAQFILYGELHDWAFKKTGQRLWHGANAPRVAQVALSLYDGASGSLIGRKVFAASEVDQQFLTSKPRHLGADFYQTDFGTQVETMLEQQAQWLSEQLECLPLRASVVAIEADRVFIDAGSEAMLLPGDQFRVLRRVSVDRMDPSLGSFFRPIGMLDLSEVYAFGASGGFSHQELQQRPDRLSSKIRVGDIVQAW